MEKNTNDKPKTGKTAIVKKKITKAGVVKGSKRGGYNKKDKPPNNTRIRRISEETIIKAINGSNQIMSNVAQVLKVDWKTAEGLVHRNERTIAAWEMAGELMVDFAESKLQEFIHIDPVSLRYYLDKKGKKRGYGESLKIDHTTKGDKLPENTPQAITVIHLPAHLQPKKEGE